VNPALRSMLLLGPETIGRPLLDVVRNADLAELFEEGSERPASGEIELGGLKPRRVLVRAAPLADGARTRFAVFVDVTDIRRLETVRRDFVANVSHELRTPVTSVLSAAETLTDALTRDPEASARFVDIIRRNAERLQRLIEDLLDLSRIESKELRLHPEAIELNPFITHALSLSRGRAEERGVRVAAEVEPGCPTVTADRRALEQVLTNLIDNAIKYCPGAAVTVRARSADGDAGVKPGRVEIDVKDTGPGIEAKHLPRLFERFYRVDAGRSREMGGTGLGLSIVKHLVDAMGGDVRVTSEIGAGSTFTISLPSAAA
jgi:two-component system phosphate regulon sensor histidine kinase PhoR